MSVSQRIRQLRRRGSEPSGSGTSWWLYGNPDGDCVVIRARDWASGPMRAVEPQEVFVTADEPSMLSRLDVPVSDILSSDRAFARLVATGEIRLIGR